MRVEREAMNLESVETIQSEKQRGKRNYEKWRAPKRCLWHREAQALRAPHHIAGSEGQEKVGRISGPNFPDVMKGVNPHARLLSQHYTG